MTSDENEGTLPEVFCRCAGRMIPFEDCEADCPAMAQIRAVAQAWRPRGLPVEHPRSRPVSDDA